MSQTMKFNCVIKYNMHFFFISFEKKNRVIETNCRMKKRKLPTIIVCTY